jgi:hypothetical protein
VIKLDKAGKTADLQRSKTLVAAAKRAVSDKERRKRYSVLQTNQGRAWDYVLVKRVIWPLSIFAPLNDYPVTRRVQ